MQQRTLLGVFAHPDDESFGPGGTLARYARQGVDVHVIIATDGIAGSVDHEGRLADHSSLAQVRSAELALAATRLGVRSIWSLPYRDSGMRGSPDNQHPQALIRQPAQQVTHEVLSYMRRLQPQVVMTHDPFGGYGHPDHIKLHQATVAAFRAAGDPSQYPGDDAPFQPQRLFFTAFSAGIFKFLVRLLPLLRQDPRRFGRNHDIDLVEIMTWETPVHARVDVRRYLSVKDAASACHASQGGGNGGPFRIIPGFLRKRWFGHETFMQGVPEPRLGASMITDLFAGVEV